MARYTGPKFKVARHLGVNVFNHPKALKRGVKPHNKMSEYGEQLIEKQTLKMYYGVLEKQLRRYVNEAVASRGNSGEVLLQNMERRLDNIVYRLAFAQTLKQARQMVNHGHVLVNGKKVDIPSYRLKIGDRISLREESDFIKACRENYKSSMASTGYIEKDYDSLEGTLARIPTRVEIPVEVKDSKIIEYYSRN